MYTVKETMHQRYLKSNHVWMFSRPSWDPIFDLCVQGPGTFFLTTHSYLQWPSWTLNILKQSFGTSKGCFWGAVSSGINACQIYPVGFKIYQLKIYGLHFEQAHFRINMFTMISEDIIICLPYMFLALEVIGNSFEFALFYRRNFLSFSRNSENSQCVST